MKKLIWFIKNLFHPGRIRKEYIRSEKRFEKFMLIDEEIQAAIDDKIYLQQGFGLSQLSSQVGVPYHQLTLYFNLYLGTSFNDWKNNLRIEYILEQFHQGRNRKLTLETLAREAGFLSRSNFLNAFVKKTGMNPSMYINLLTKQNNAN